MPLKFLSKRLRVDATLPSRTVNLDDLFTNCFLNNAVGELEGEANLQKIPILSVCIYEQIFI